MNDFIKNMIDEIIAVGKNIKGFKLNYILDIQEIYENKKTLSNTQWESLKKIYEKWDIQSQSRLLKEEGKYFYETEDCDINES